MLSDTLEKVQHLFRPNFEKVYIVSFEDCPIAHDSGAKFNGVLCGRATWAGSVEPYIKEGEKAAREWLRTTGFENIDELNKVLVKTASPWTDKV